MIRLFDKVKRFITDNEYKITIYENQIYIMNYIEIISLTEKTTTILIPNAKLIIKGINLHLEKICDKELLIKGKTLSVEVEYNE